MAFKPLAGGESKGEKPLHGTNVSFSSTASAEGRGGAAVRTRRIARAFVCSSVVATAIFAASMVLFLLASAEMFKKNRPRRISLAAGDYWFVYEKVQLIGEGGSRRSEKEVALPYNLHRVTCVWEIQPTVAGAGTSATKSQRSLVFFVHGNAGSYTDPSRLSCAMSREANFKGELYAFDFLHQANIHRGKLLQQQAAFVAETLASLQRRSVLKRLTDNTVLHGAETLKSRATPENQDGAISIWIVGHSMGGVVARLAVEMLRSSGSSIFIESIITLNSPHRFPPIFLDNSMLSVYKTLWQPPYKNSALNLSRRHSPRFYSVTSGALDLQVEPWLTNLNRTGDGPSTDVMFRTDDPNVCGRVFSHTDALRDHCVVEFLTGVIANRSVREHDVKTSATPVYPTVPTGDSVLLWWAELSVKSHTLPALLLSFYTVLVLSAIHPTVLRLLLQCSSKSAYRVFGFLWWHQLVMLLRITTMGGVVLAALLIGIVGQLLLVQLRCCLLPWSDMCSLPWVADDLVCSAETRWGHLPLLFIAWLGPALLGSWAGVVAYCLLRGWLRLSLRVWTVLRSMCLSRFHILSDSRSAGVWRHLVLLLYPITVIVCTASLELYQRNFVWLGFILFVMPLCVAMENGSGANSYPVMCIDASVPVAVYAWLCTLQLQSFLAWRNKWVSGMTETKNIVDEGSHIPEILLHLIVCTYLVWPIRHLFDLRKSGDSLRFQFPPVIGSIFCVVVLSAFVVIYMSLLAMNRVSVEAFRVVWVLLWGFPAFLFASTLGSDDAVAVSAAPPSVATS
ncbi:GPI inositol deacylase 2 [Trypanosoma conorhini]|uniref:GPI inositol-deacylase n=1 Tax=Trypanosoma conorhini TaxID=83891 RepID=A0A422QAL2_9TRYP|nr:GPI inositol deacylase 2 [Trypanosoma conorhini]RNF26994.1 GPI inositol deacylase 2 [Trypanosoma conorhini]